MPLRLCCTIIRMLLISEQVTHPQRWRIVFYEPTCPGFSQCMLCLIEASKVVFGAALSCSGTRHVSMTSALCDALFPQHTHYVRAAPGSLQVKPCLRRCLEQAGSAVIRLCAALPGVAPAHAGEVAEQPAASHCCTQALAAARPGPQAEGPAAATGLWRPGPAFPGCGSSHYAIHQARPPSLSICSIDCDVLGVVQTYCGQLFSPVPADSFC